VRAIILAGGRGTRLAPYTTVFPKPLVPVGDMPILEIVVKQLRLFGITKITLAVGHLAELIVAYFGNGSRHGVQIDYSREEQPLGTAGPLSLIGNLDDTFLVMNGDLLTTLDFRGLLAQHRASGAMATIAAYERQTKIDLGILEIDGQNRITAYIEKPTYINRVSMGIYAFEPEVLSFVPKGIHFDLPDLIIRLLHANQDVRASVFDGFWLDIGRPADYAYVTENTADLLPKLLHQSGPATANQTRDGGVDSY
jgi:NDP-sugar pyrophosphorylase family protein